MILYIASAAIICAVSMFLVMHSQYEDGIFGRLALIVLIFSNGLIVADWWIDGSEWEIRPNTLATQIAMALFMLRHAYRFLMWRLSGDYPWREAKK